MALLVVGGLMCLSACGGGARIARAYRTKTQRALICPSYGAHPAGRFNASVLLSKTLTAARVLAARYGCTVTVAERDGRDQMIQAMEAFGRILVDVDQNRVVRVDGVG